MSSKSSTDAAGFSGLGVGWEGWERGTLLKKEVIGLYMGFGLAGDLAGDFLVVDALDAFGDAARVWDRVGLFVSLSACDPGGMLVSAPLVGGWGGGERDSLCSESDERTTGLFRAERSLAMPRRIAGSEELLAAQGHGRGQASWGREWQRECLIASQVLYVAVPGRWRKRAGGPKRAKPGSYVGRPWASLPAHLCALHPSPSFTHTAALSPLAPPR